MSEPQATRDPVAEFLRDLEAELTWPPSELSARRAVKAAAKTVRNRHVRRRGLAIRSGAVTAALAMVVGTSGVAFAGGLPRPVQSIVADAAHMLPVPLPIPYPTSPPLDELPEMTIPATDETPDPVVVPEEPSGTEAQKVDPSASNAEATTDVTTSEADWTTSDGADRASGFAEDGSGRGWESGSVADGAQRDSSDEHNRGWDDWRKSDQWGNGPDDHDRQETTETARGDNDRDR